jgi:hypothetical protein
MVSVSEWLINYEGKGTNKAREMNEGQRGK